MFLSLHLRLVKSVSTDLSCLVSRSKTNVARIAVRSEAEYGVVVYMCTVELASCQESVFLGASLNSSASHLFQTPPPVSDWLYADRLHAIDR
ncbi:hypothetical protein T05_12787 [Trichinella murrelli]|nr:hypothetical protein T05_12787 [Trichinella murrelli]